MALARRAWIEGKRVVTFSVYTFDDGRGGVAHAPKLVFDDGSELDFVVEETDVGRYGICPVYWPPKRRKRREAAGVAENGKSSIKSTT